MTTSEKEELVETLNKELNKALKEYNELQSKKSSIEEDMEALKESIMSKMDELGLNKTTTPDNITASIVMKETFKYTDEPALVKYLKDNNLSQFIVEKVNAVPMNKELKKGMSLTENLKSMYTKTVSRSFIVKKA